MAQPNVAREPSMEEILASIRKIIESNEPGAGKSISASLPPVYAASNDDDSIHLTVDDDLEEMPLDDVPPTSMPDPRFVAANSSGAVRESEEPARTMSLADVAARVRAASERNSSQPGAVREMPPQRELPPAMAARFAEVRREPIAPPPLRAVTPEFPPPLSLVATPAIAEIPQAPAPVVDLPAIVELQLMDSEPSEPVSEQLPATEMSVVEPSPMLVQQEMQVAEELAFPPVQPELPKMLMSEAAGQQVARSFEDLVAAIDGAERRSLDEIAQEMLRPMLQEWLDDNLPTLVERLVREEIERVARGPRR
ncbi:DUF2497 domain-containing protein [Rhizobium sp. BK376]|uniref:PopZ family protein n=1 Tax=Rhizobium sp. BK376 TaxID=2512149 RepID=UPI001052E662|nr:DUF2497 domain-containing protein [Rhizobium sp. BK376]TCR92650.1 hypothetical protein EV561_10183 [Rhizobium sp. BK376]